MQPHIQTSLEYSKYEDKKIPAQFDSGLWQQYYDATQEPMLKILSELSSDFINLKSELHTATQERKKLIQPRLKSLEKNILALDESYKAGRAYVGSLCNSFYVEFKQLERSKNYGIEEMYNSFTFCADLVISLCERNISNRK